MPGQALNKQVDDIRRFNRFYTEKIGVLHEGLLDSPFSLTEVRVLYEVAHRDAATAAEVARDLSLDAGYLSRLLTRLERRGLISKERAKSDGRVTLLKLTTAGRKAFDVLNERASEEVSSMLKQIPVVERNRLVRATETIQQILGHPGGRSPSYLLRPSQPGDMGWVVYRHGVLYTQEYGYDEQFEALVAEIVAQFVQNFDPKRERCWIAEKDGEIVGSVFLVKKSNSVAKLRLLYVEPKARGLGIGRRLVEECARFARQAGYQRLTLWTQSDLYAARHIYKQTGFHVVNKKRHNDFGKPLVAETWDLDL